MRKINRPYTVYAAWRMAIQEIQDLGITLAEREPSDDEQELGIVKTVDYYDHGMHSLTLYNK